jgi:hypothetical protein
MGYFKIFNESDKHNNFQFQNGLNIDSQEFNPNPDQKYVKGGFYFSNENNILWFLSYGNFIREVEIPENETNIVHFEDKSRAKSLFLHPKKDLRKLKTWLWLKQKNVNLNVNEDQALRWAAQNGYLEIVEFLLENSANLKTNENYALSEAARNGHLEIVKFLVKNGANVHAWNNYALRWAAENNHLEVVKYLETVDLKKEWKMDYQAYIVKFTDTDGTPQCFAWYPDFGHSVCSAIGDNAQEALSILMDVKKDVIALYRNKNKTLPVPGSINVTYDYLEEITEMLKESYKEEGID